MTSWSAISTDFYVNQKLALKMDLPTARETVLDMCDRIRKELPQMDRFRRYEGELALESIEQESEYCWMALRRTSVRSGWVNPDTLPQAYKLHQLILEVAPYYLTISPLDVEYHELVFGFDLETATNQHEIVFETLLGNSLLAGMLNLEEEAVLDAQPFIGFSLTSDCNLQAYVEVKSRSQPADVAANEFRNEPISVYLTVRRYGPLSSIDAFSDSFSELAQYAERLAEARVVPQIVMPLREALLSHPGT